MSSASSGAMPIPVSVTAIDVVSASWVTAIVTRPPGRVNFTARRFAEARWLMLRSFTQELTLKRLALFAIAQASQLAGVALVPRLRFLDEDARA